MLKDDLHHSGYFGEFIPCYPLNPPPGYPVIYNTFRLCSSGQENVVFPAVLPDPCDLNSAVVETVLSTLTNGFALPVTGYNNPLSTPIPCLIADSDFASGTDVLVVRRASTDRTAMASLTPGSVYIQTGYDATSNAGYVIGTWTSATTCTGLRSTGFGTPPVIPVSISGDPATVFSLQQKNPNEANATLPANIRGYDVHIYFIRPWSVDPAENPRIPTLARAVLTHNGIVPAIVAEPLIKGIENMQVQYGIDDGTAPGISYDGTADRYTTAPASIADWSNVVTVRVNLLARKVDPDFGFTDRKTYDLGEGPFAPGGNFNRHVFSNLVRLANVAGRRECATTPACN